jgi:hypothetical protein
MGGEVYSAGFLWYVVGLRFVVGEVQQQVVLYIDNEVLCYDSR